MSSFLKRVVAAHCLMLIGIVLIGVGISIVNLGVGLACAGIGCGVYGYLLGAE